jgi:hypothetical protein
MRFLVQIEVHATIAGREADRQLREVLGPQIQHVLGSGTVREAGFLADRRGGFFLIDIDAAEELYALLGPEIYGTCRVEAAPVAPPERVGELFAQWAQDGR